MNDGLTVPKPHVSSGRMERRPCRPQPHTFMPSLSWFGKETEWLHKTLARLIGFFRPAGPVLSSVLPHFCLVPSNQELL